MSIEKGIVILLKLVIVALLYYKLATSKKPLGPRIAFVFKVCLWVFSILFILFGKDYIPIGSTLGFHENTTVMMLVVFDIAEAFIDRWKNKRQD